MFSTDDILGQIKGWFTSLPVIGGLLALALPFFWPKLSENETFKGIIDKVSGFFSGIWDKITGFFRGKMAPEQETAKTDVENRIDNHSRDKNGAFEKLEATLGLSADASEKMGEMAKKRAKEFFSNDATSEEAALEASNGLYQDLEEYLYKSLREKVSQNNHRPTPQELNNIRAAANRGAAYLSDITQDSRNDAAYLQHGFGGLLTGAVSELKDKQYSTGDIKPVTFNEALLNAAGVAARGEKNYDREGQEISTPPTTPTAGGQQPGVTR